MDDIESISKLAIHQPNFAPWLGYFLKMAQADTFILLDDVQFSKGSYTPRVRIHQKLFDGNQWLTIPIKKHSATTAISEIQLDRSQDIETMILNKLDAVYGKTNYYNQVVGEIEVLIQDLKETELLADFNQKWIEWFRSVLDINTPLEYSSQMEKTDSNEQVILQICRSKKASVYISGQGGKSYIDLKAFNRYDIGVEFVDYGNSIKNRFPKRVDSQLTNKSILSWLMLIPQEEIRQIFKDS